MHDSRLIQAEIMTVARTDKGTAVLIKPLGSDRVVPIFIGTLEAQAILIGLGKVPMPRPLTHDLLVTVLEKSKTVINTVEITDLQNDTFYAHLSCKQGVRKFTIDCRPSDALALVTRLSIPLFIHKEIVDEVGIPVSMISEESTEHMTERSNQEEDPLDPETQQIKAIIEEGEHQLGQLRLLRIELNKAIESEDYEAAAKIRDSLKALGDSDDLDTI